MTTTSQLHLKATKTPYEQIENGRHNRTRTCQTDSQDLFLLTGVLKVGGQCRGNVGSFEHVGYDCYVKYTEGLYRLIPIRHEFHMSCTIIGHCVLRVCLINVITVSENIFTALWLGQDSPWKHVLNTETQFLYDLCEIRCGFLNLWPVDQNRSGRHTLK